MVLLFHVSYSGVLFIFFSGWGGNYEPTCVGVKGEASLTGVVCVGSNGCAIVEDVVSDQPDIYL